MAQLAGKPEGVRWSIRPRSRTIRRSDRRRCRCNRPSGRRSPNRSPCRPWPAAGVSMVPVGSAGRPARVIDRGEFGGRRFVVDHADHVARRDRDRREIGAGPRRRRDRAVLDQGRDAADVNSYQRAWASLSVARPTFWSATSRPSRYSALRIRVSFVATCPPGCWARGGSV